MLRWFHNAGGGTMVSTQSLSRELLARGFKRTLRWSRGVDHTIFNPAAAIPLDFPRPIFLYAGRLAVEKEPRRLSCRSICREQSSSPATARRGAALEARYPDARFLGVQDGG